MERFPLLIGMDRILSEIHRGSDRIFRKHGLTRGQFAVMEALYHKGDMAIGEVQKKILTTEGNIPVIVRNLIRSGYISRYGDPKDGRRKLLHLTDDGKRRIAACMPENNAYLREMFRRWTPEEQARMLQLLHKFGGKEHDPKDS